MKSFWKTFIAALGWLAVWGCQECPAAQLASWEQLDEAGRVGAYGIAYDPNALTCATRRWPKGAVLKVTAIDNGLWVIVTVTDRNPRGRCIIDLSWRAFGVLAGHELGVAEVSVEVVPAKIIRVHPRSSAVKK
jgi:rare lipoprotein A